MKIRDLLFPPKFEPYDVTEVSEYLPKLYSTEMSAIPKLSSTEVSGYVQWEDGQRQIIAAGSRSPFDGLTRQCEYCGRRNKYLDSVCEGCGAPT